MENLLKFIAEHADADVSRLILDRMKYPDIDIEYAVNCIESRRKLKDKVQEWHDEPRLVFPLKLSAEQCSSSATGVYKAALAERIAGYRAFIIADLTGGLGVDSWFFSKKAEKVFYNEMQPVLCDAARHNFKILNADNIVISNHLVEKGHCLDFIKDQTDAGQPDLIFIDPARRSESGKKVFLIEECMPDVLTLKDELFSQCRNILIKLSPMADISMVCSRLGSTCREVHVVATGGECKELLIWMDREWNREYSVIAAELQRNREPSVFTFKPSEEKSAVRYMASGTMPSAEYGYLFEPGKSMMKAGAFGLMAERFGIAKLGRSTHYYLTGSKEKAEILKRYGKVFSIMESTPLDKRSIKDAGKRYPKAEVTARNIPMDTDTLRKRLNVAPGDDVHIFGLKSDSSGNMLFITKRL